MKEILMMSPAELAAELLAVSPGAVASDASAIYAVDNDDEKWQDFETLILRRLSIAREILLRDLLASMKATSVLNSPNLTRDWLKLYCAYLEHEVFIVLHLDSRHHLIAVEEIFRGTLSHTSVYPREIVKSVLAHRSVSVLLAHNHPSGNTAPSESDLYLTKQLVSALSLVDSHVSDHFIVAGNNVLSFTEQGYL
ncbi:MAG: JAB domain-containing protein [Pseudomonadota bacterium]